MGENSSRYLEIPVTQIFYIWITSKDNNSKPKLKKHIACTNDKDIADLQMTKPNRISESSCSKVERRAYFFLPFLRKRIMIEPFKILQNGWLIFNYCIFRFKIPQPLRKTIVVITLKNNFKKVLISFFYFLSFADTPFWLKFEDTD